MFLLRFVQRSPRALRRGTFVLCSAAFLCAFHLVAGAAVAGCGDSTTGQRVVLHTEVTAGEEAQEPIVNAFDWSITLTKAHLSVGELYYFDGPPVVARTWPRAPGGLRGWLGIPSAFAHPGHYTEGDALGQMLKPTTVDVLQDATLPDGDGVTGTYRSARFQFASPPAGDLAKELGGHVVVVEGKATKGAEARVFRLSADQAEILNADQNPYVEGCVFNDDEVTGNGTILLTLHPSVWLDQVDFETTPASADGAPVDVDPADKAHKAFIRGLQKGTGYGFSYVKDTTTSE